MISYNLQSDYREATLTRDDLAVVGKDRVKETAREIVTRRAQGLPRNLNFSSIHFRELRDVVVRAAEELSRFPDEDLDYYFKARRGVPTFYAPLFLGVARKSYLRSASLQCVGEGLALYLLEDRHLHPNLFDLVLRYRPLGDPPDLIMRYRSDDSRYALVEAKATEKEDLDDKLTEAMGQLIELFKAWQNQPNHRDLEKTDGFAVATSVFVPGTFKVSILKVRF